VRKLLIFIALFAICDAVVATSSPDPSQDVEKPVRVDFNLSVSIDGLEQTGASLEDFAARLRQQLEQLDESELSEEQIRQLERLTAQADRLGSLLPEALAQLEQSANQLAAQTAQRMQAEAIAPSLLQLDTLISGWLWRLVLGGLLVIAAIGVVVYFSLSQLRQASRHLARVSGDYRIIHRDQLAQLGGGETKLKPPTATNGGNGSSANNSGGGSGREPAQ